MERVDETSWYVREDTGITGQTSNGDTDVVVNTDELFLVCCELASGSLFVSHRRLHRISVRGVLQVGHCQPAPHRCGHAPVPPPALPM